MNTNYRGSTTPSTRTPIQPPRCLQSKDRRANEPATLVFLQLVLLDSIGRYHRCTIASSSPSTPINIPNSSEGEIQQSQSTRTLVHHQFGVRKASKRLVSYTRVAREHPPNDSDTSLACVKHTARSKRSEGDTPLAVSPLQTLRIKSGDSA